MWAHSVASAPTSRFIFIDESGAKTTMTRLYGRGFDGGLFELEVSARKACRHLGLSYPTVLRAYTIIAWQSFLTVSRERCCLGGAWGRWGLFWGQAQGESWSRCSGKSAGIWDVGARGCCKGRGGSQCHCSDLGEHDGLDGPAWQYHLYCQIWQLWRLGVLWLSPSSYWP